MKNISSKFFLIAALLVSTTSPVAAATPTPITDYVKSKNKIAVATAIATFIYLTGWKDEPDANPMGFKEGVKGFVTINPLSTKYYAHLWKFIDDVIIGYQGKKRGFRVTTSKITSEGEPQSEEAKIQKMMKNGEKVHLYTAENADAYGLIGSIWSYINPGLKGLGTVKKSIDTLDWTGNVLLNNNL